MKCFPCSNKCQLSGPPRGDTSGAAFVEATLVLGILLMMIFGIIEFGRFFSIQSLLTKGAQDAAAVSSRIHGFDIDVRTLEDTAKGIAEYNDFYESRRQVAATGAFLATSSLVNSSPTAELAGMLPMTITDKTSGANFGGSTSDTLLVAALRPGDSASYVDPKTGATQWLDHPMRCADHSPTCLAKIDHLSDWNDLLLNQPLYIELRARVRLLIPFAPQQVTVQGRAFAYREIPNLSIYSGTGTRTVATITLGTTTTITGSGPHTSHPITTTTRDPTYDTTGGLGSTTRVVTTTRAPTTTTPTLCSLSPAICFDPANGLCIFDAILCRCLPCAG